MPVHHRAQNQGKYDGVSVIVSTKRPFFLRNIFANYKRQLYPEKELIVITNDEIDTKKYPILSRQHASVSVYTVDKNLSLGECLNFAVSKSKYPIITKFDDDDYYSPYYLNGVVSCLKKSKADVLGKNTCFLYLKSRNLLLLFHPNRTHQYSDLIMGSTLSFRRQVFSKVKFLDVSQGEDTYFLRDCAKRKIAIYSCDQFNYVCIRRPNLLSHTWRIDEKTLIEHSRIIRRTSDFSKYITRVVPLPK